MGLDMYAHKVPLECVEDEFNFQSGGAYVDPQQLYYWRKHHDLHGWMQDLYYDAGGTADSFNCVNIRLHIDNLMDLEDAIRKRTLPPTVGFFFGNSPPDDQSDAEDLEFIKLATEAINSGFAVYYSSWW